MSKCKVLYAEQKTLKILAMFSPLPTVERIKLSELHDPTERSGNSKKCRKLMVLIQHTSTEPNIYRYDTAALLMKGRIYSEKWLNSDFDRP